MYLVVKKNRIELSLTDEELKAFPVFLFGGHFVWSITKKIFFLDSHIHSFQIVTKQAS